MGDHIAEGKDGQIVNQPQQRIQTNVAAVLGETKEIVMPFGKNVECGTSDLGEIFIENGVQYMRFDRICLADNKELDSIHSGNVNAFKLALPLPPFSFLREKL